MTSRRTKIFSDLRFSSYSSSFSCDLSLHRCCCCACCYSSSSSSSSAAGHLLWFAVHLASSTIFYHSRRSLTIICLFFIAIINLVRSSVFYMVFLYFLIACTVFVAVCFGVRWFLHTFNITIKSLLEGSFKILQYRPLALYPVTPCRFLFSSVLLTRPYVFLNILPFKYRGRGSSFRGHFPGLSPLSQSGS